MNTRALLSSFLSFAIRLPTWVAVPAAFAIFILAPVLLDASLGGELSGSTWETLAWFLYYPALVIAAIFFIARLILYLVRQDWQQGLFGIIQRTPLREAVPVAIGVLFLVFLPDFMREWNEILLLSRYPVIALVAVFFSVHLLQSLIGGHGKLRIIGALCALAALHVLLGLASYYMFPHFYQTPRSLYEELLDVDFWVFPAIFTSTWCLVAVLLLVHANARTRHDFARPLRTLAVGVGTLLAAIALSTFTSIPSIVAFIASQGADLPPSTIFFLKTGGAWLAIAATGAVLTVVVLVAADRWRRATRITFGSLVALLALTNLAAYAAHGTFFYPYFKMCGGNEDVAGFTRLHAAVYLGHEDSARRLIERGAPFDAPGEGGATPLRLAVEDSRLAVIRVLLDKGADVNFTADGQLRSLLNVASRNDNIAIATLLLDRGAKVNLADVHSERTPLHTAGSTVMATLLIARGADVNAEDRNGKTPLDLALDRADRADRDKTKGNQGAQWRQVADLLIEHGAKRSTAESRKQKLARAKPPGARAESRGSCIG